MSESVLVIDGDLPDLKDYHERLYREAREERQLSIEGRHELIGRVKFLLSRMAELAKQATDTDEFNWLSDACTQWQTVYSEVFNIPEDVREKVGVVSPPSRELRPVPPVLSDTQIRSYLERTAHELSESRKLTTLYRQLEFLRHQRGSIHRAIPSSDQDMKDDWYDAQVYLASEVLGSKFDFARRFGAATFPYLESVWLDDVKRLRAYRLWERQGACWDPYPDRFYLDACEGLRRSFAEFQKGSPAAFECVRNYIEKRYLTQQKISSDSECARRLISRKAHRLWQLRGETPSRETDWQEAERYVRSYYESIVSAVTGAVTERPRSIKAIVKAVESYHHLVNAFEAAVYMTFVDLQVIRKSPGNRVDELDCYSEEGVLARP